MQKHAATPEDILRWLLGSAALGATARLGLAGVNREFGRQDPLKPETDLYDPSIEVPVPMSPEQHARFLELKARAGGPVKRAMWDNSVAAASMVGGAALGWHVLDRMIKRRKKKQLDQELARVRDELSTLGHEAPPTEAKLAGIWSWLDHASQQHVVRKALRESTKVANVLKDVGSFVRTNPAELLALGGTAGLLGLSALPGVREGVNRMGEGVSGTTWSAIKGLSSPLASGAMSVLGPIATLSLIYGLAKGYDKLEKENPRKLELSALRKRIRDEESRATPYFRLQPVITGETGATRSAGSAGSRAKAIGARYQDVDAARDAERV